MTSLVLMPASIMPPMLPAVPPVMAPVPTPAVGETGPGQMTWPVDNNRVSPISSEINQHSQCTADNGADYNTFRTPVDDLSDNRPAGTAQQQTFQPSSMASFRRANGCQDNGHSNN